MGLCSEGAAGAGVALSQRGGGRQGARWARASGAAAVGTGGEPGGSWRGPDGGSLLRGSLPPHHNPKGLCLAKCWEAANKYTYRARTSLPAGCPRGERESLEAFGGHPGVSL